MDSLWSHVKILAQEMGIDAAEVEERKAFLCFDSKDEERLRGINDIAQTYADSVIEELYRHFLSFDATREFFKDPRVLERVQRMQKEYFLRLTTGEYGSDYVSDRLRIGVVHERIQLPVKWYLGGYGYYVRAVAERLLAAHRDDPAAAGEIFQSLLKLVFMDIGLAIDTYIYQRESTIRKQQDAIRELSTPVLQIRERLLLLPIIGVIDTHRARLLTEGLLKAIRANRARVVVMDITGVATIDSRVANHLIQTVTAARLMGSHVIVSGLSPEVAQSIVQVGVDLTKLHTVGDLQGGIEEAEKLLGYQMVPLEGR